MTRRRSVVVFDGRAGEEEFSRRVRAVSLGSRPSFVRLRFVEPDAQTMPGVHLRETTYGEEAIVAWPEKKRRKLWTGPIDEIVADEAGPWLPFVSPETLLSLPDDACLPGAFERTHEGWRRKGTVAPQATLTDEVIVVGMGLAGAFVVDELTARGVKVTVVDRYAVPAAGASALCCGLLHPHRQAAENPLFALTRAGFLSTCEVLQRHPDCWAPIGVLDVARDDATWNEWRAANDIARPFAMPSDFVRLVSKTEAQAIAGVPVRRGGWWYASAGLVRVGRLVRSLLMQSGAILRTATAVRLERRDHLWHAVSATGEVVARAPGVVVAAGLTSAAVAGVDEKLLPIDPLYGRISLLANDPYPGLRTALTGHGYLGKLDGFLGVGATYERGETRVLSNNAAHEHNLGAFTDVLAPSESPIPVGFYEGIRAVASDRLPVVGPAPDAKALRGLSFRGAPEASSLPMAPGLWFCTAMGSRGITWGRLCARTLVREMAGEAPLLEAPLVAALSPLRFAARAFRETRGEAIL